MTSTTSATPSSRDALNGPSCAMWICRSTDLGLWAVVAEGEFLSADVFESPFSQENHWKRVV